MNTWHLMNACTDPDEQGGYVCSPLKNFPALDGVLNQVICPFSFEKHFLMLRMRDSRPKPAVNIREIDMSI